VELRSSPFTFKSGRRKKMRTHILLISTMVVLVVGVLGGVQQEALAADEKPIVLGVPGPFAFHQGDEGKKAVDLAIEEINAAGGVNVAGFKRPFTAIHMDTRDLEAGVPVSESLMVVEKLIMEHKADFIIGGPTRSEAAIASMGLASRYKKIHLISNCVWSPVYTKNIAENYDKYKYCFRATFNIKDLMPGVLALFGWLKDKYHFDKAYIIVQDVAHARAAGDGVKATLEKQGWTITGYDKYPTGSSDFSKALLNAKEAKTQFIFGWIDGPEGSILVKQWRDMKIPTLLGGSIVGMGFPTDWKDSGGAIEYAQSYITRLGHIPTPKIPWSERFYSAWVKKYKVEPLNEVSSTAYMGPYILKDAIERAGSLKAEAVISALEKTDMPAVYGRVRFDPKSHDLIHGTDPKTSALSGWFQWIGGKRIVIYPDSVAVGPIKMPPWMK
jgi:branched-chain amino acid transport system substrate-binding protein